MTSLISPIDSLALFFTVVPISLLARTSPAWWEYHCGPLAVWVGAGVAACGATLFCVVVPGEVVEGAGGGLFVWASASGETAKPSVTAVAAMIVFMMFLLSR
jgi:hypothetical protein